MPVAVGCRTSELSHFIEVPSGYYDPEKLVGCYNHVEVSELGVSLCEMCYGVDSNTIVPNQTHCAFHYSGEICE